MLVPVLVPCSSQRSSPRAAPCSSHARPRARPRVLPRAGHPSAAAVARAEPSLCRAHTSRVLVPHAWLALLGQKPGPGSALLPAAFSCNRIALAWGHEQFPPREFSAQ